MELTLLGVSLTLPQLLAAQAVVNALLLAALAGIDWRQRRLRRELDRTRQHLGLLRTQLEALQARREAEASAAAPAPTPAAGFSDQLRQVEQQARQTGLAHRGAPEKYRYVAALADQGLTAVQIARALHMAPAEVEQAVRLARLRSGRSAVETNETAASGR